ncbi:MAG: tetratricopeptide repeat protein, partial [Candidatus Thorarchaeota archaeon]
MKDKWFNKGNILFSKSKLSKAVDAFKRDLALNPSRKISYLKIALSYNKLQMMDEAKEYYNKALNLDSKESYLPTIFDKHKDKDLLKAYRKVIGINVE